MAGMASGSVFQTRGRSNSRVLSTRLDADGNIVEVESREDEEQTVKLQETVDLLLAAGYFRARIKGLSNFDKVVGGMTWCIETCNFDVDVDLLFQENLTIGQKIALTEKIVAVLPKMKCPHRLEPHQIQGLDFIHIFPVVQWLVKKAIETREELGDYIRSYSVSQFNKTHRTPEDEAFVEQKEKSLSTLAHIQDTYKPRRKFRRQATEKLKDEKLQVQSTLLEYGRLYGFSRQAANQDGDEEIKDDRSKQKEFEETRKAEEQVKELMSGMLETEDQEIKLTASVVGSIVGLKSAPIDAVSSAYVSTSEISSLEGSGMMHHKRLASALTKQLAQRKGDLEETSKKHTELQQRYMEVKAELEEMLNYNEKLAQEMVAVEEMENEGNRGILQKLRSLVAMNESLKRQEREFKDHCKEEMGRLQTTIEELNSEGMEDEMEDQERTQLVEKQYLSDKEKLHKIRLLLARKNREIAIIQRKIDEVPSRAELSQYQRRFVELYNQVAAKHKETKQFYTLYNTLDDTKLYLTKEVNLLNSILDNFTEAMASISTKEQFLKQFEQIVEGIKVNKAKLEKKKQEEKMRRDHLSDTYLDLVEKQRLYFKTVKDLKEECRKNEMLLAKMKTRGQ